MSPPLFLLFSLLIVCAILATCFAETLTLKRELKSGPSAGLTKVDTLRFLPPLEHTTSSSADETNDAMELLDVVLVASVDGKFHALNRRTGEKLWSMPSTSMFTAGASGASASVPPSLQPLIATQHADYGLEVDDETLMQETYIIEPQSGDIYVASSPSGPLQRLPFSMPQLVDMSPFSFGEGDRRVFVGRKKTSLLLIELETGRVKAALDSECPWDPFDDFAERDVMDVDLDELMVQSLTVLITLRKSTLDAPSPSSRRPPVQNLSFSTYGPNNQDLEQQAVYHRTADDTYVESLPNGEIISLKTNNPTSSDSANFMWAQKFANPIVAIFDVVRSQKRKDPFVLLQPRPRLQDVLPTSDLPAAVKSRRFPNLDSAYVGLVKETGSLFALSPDHFPLVVFGGTHDKQLKAIDPPPGVMDPRATNAPLDLRELCSSGSTDRRCLTGVRPLEANSRSRLARLLDGAPTVALPPSANSNSQIYESDTLQEQPVGIEGGNTSFGHSWPWVSSGQQPTRHGESPAVHSSAAALFALVVLAISAFWIVRKRSVHRLVEKVSALVKETPVQDELKGQAVVGTARSDDPIPSENDVREPASSPPLDHPPIPKNENAKALVVNGSESAEPIADAAEDDSEKEGDAAATPGKRKSARRRRGKKKKGNAKEAAVEEGEGDGDENEKPEKLEDFVVVPTPAPSLVLPTPKPVSSPSLIVSDTVLGFGSHGTVVYQGSLQGRAVAVKRLLQDFVTLASREVSLLQDADDHPNVIRYYYQEAQANFLYIALELCPASLADIIERPDQLRDIAVAFDPKKALRQITSGLRHLHALKIVHRDIKPQNILISSAKKGVGESSGHRMLISDFGLCRKLEFDQTSFVPTANGVLGVGTVGWRAPEILRGEVKLDEAMSDDSQSSRDSVETTTSNSTAGKSNPTRLTKSVDIFALGCLFYYVLTNGGHPFGDRFEREVNILRNARSLDGLEQFGEEGSEAVDLISAMLEPEASARPDTSTCLMHPYFWDPGRRLAFLQDASDRFEIMCRDPRDPDLTALEEGAINVVGPDWPSRLDKIFVENLGKFRKYDGRSVQDLLRALRNKKHHYQDLPDNVKRHVGSMPEGYLSYFTRRFPRLFLHVHSVIANSSLRQESMFRSYFDLTE